MDQAKPSATSSTLGREASRIPSLDGLRALSILCVIIGHLLEGYHVDSAVFLPGLGVHVFFVISGYLITRLLQTEHIVTGRINLPAFYRRRCFRLLPAAFAYIIVIGSLVPESRSGLPYALTYTVSYDFRSIPAIFRHLWSLSIEEQFYLLWPLALISGFRYRGRIAISVVGLAALFRLSLALSPIGGAAYIASIHFLFPGAMDSIAAGCLVAIYESHIRERWGWMAESPAIVIALPLVAWVLYSACWGGSTVFSRLLAVFWFAVPMILALWVFLMIQRRDWIVNNTVANFIGVTSYSLYLWQEPFTVTRTHSAIFSLLSLGACALGSYFLVEKPMIRLGRRPSMFASTTAGLPLKRASDVSSS